MAEHRARRALYVIGFGPGDESMLTGKARDKIKTAKRVLNTRETPLSELMRALESPFEGDTAVLVSGDCGFYSVSKSIVRDFSDLYDIEIIPGIGSIQYFSAKIKVSYDDAAIISLHGRTGNIAATVSYNKKVFALTGGESKVGDICRELCRRGLGGVTVSVGERLSYPDERLVTDKAEKLKDMAFDDLSVMYIENQSAVNPHVPLRDIDFIRSDVPMTKEEVRWLSIRKLCVSPGDIICDIGAGTGSVSVEMARQAFNGFVYAIEGKEAACSLVRENAAKHGAFNIEIVHGRAPGALSGLPAPDKAFIGGSSGNMDGILGSLVALNPGIRIVANAITLQTLDDVVKGFEKHGLSDTDTICVNISKSRKTSGYDMMIAQNPVYIVTGARSEAGAADAGGGAYV